MALFEAAWDLSSDATRSTLLEVASGAVRAHLNDGSSPKTIIKQAEHDFQVMQRVSLPFSATRDVEMGFHSPASKFFHCIPAELWFVACQHKFFEFFPQEYDFGVCRIFFRSIPVVLSGLTRV